MRSRKKKSARELRQGGSDYRCCIPALAGFVSPQSIAPDGKQISMQDRQRATQNSEQARLLAEWKIRLYASHIRIVHERCFAQTAFALCTLRRQQMASRRVRAQHFAARGDFKTLRH